MADKGVRPTFSLDQFKGNFNMQSFGGSMMGLSGGSGGGMGGLKYFGKAVGNFADAYNDWANADTQASAYKTQARISAMDAQLQGRLQSEDLRAAGDTAVRNIGVVQKQGMDTSVMRLGALGREISMQRVSAAGSGIDVGSRTVRKAAETSRANASWDVARIGESTKIAADNLNTQAETAYRNSAYATINANYFAKQAQIEGNLNAKMAKINGQASLLTNLHNGVVNIGKGIADMWSGGMVSMADSAGGGNLGMA